MISLLDAAKNWVKFNSIHVGQFLTAVADHLKARLSESLSLLLGQITKPYHTIIYCEQSVVALAKRLKLACRSTVEQFRKLKDGKQ